MATYYCENTPHGRTKTGIKINTVSHFDYIMRRGNYAHMEGREEDLVYTENGNVPAWADNMRDYWNEAELHRRSNGRNYREIRLGLMEEFSLEDNLEMVHDFMDYFGISQNHAYSLAVHDKAAAFDKTHRNVHVHLMFDERIIDNREIGPDLCFKRYVENENGEAVGGWMKDRYFNERASVSDMRQKWEELVNAKFKEKGMDLRVSCKTLKEQREDCLKKGLFEEARLLERERAPHLGGVYRNPKKMKQIEAMRMELEREFDPSYAPSYGEVISPKNEENKDAKTEDEAAQKALVKQAEEDRRILLFVTDLVMRQTARKIQSERRKYRAEMKEAEKKVWDAAERADQFNNKKDPCIITAGDIFERLSAEEKLCRKEAVEKMISFKAESENSLSKEDLLAAAKDQITGGKYGILCKKLEEIGKQYKALRRERRDIMSGTDPKQKIDFLKVYTPVSMKWESVNKAMDTMEDSFAKEKKPELERALDMLVRSNKQKEAEVGKLYGQSLAAAKRADMLHSRILALQENFREGQILFSEAVPRMLYPSAKINGEVPVFTLPKSMYNGKLFMFLPKENGSENEAVYSSEMAGLYPESLRMIKEGNTPSLDNRFGDLYLARDGKDRDTRLLESTGENLFEKAAGIRDLGPKNTTGKGTMIMKAVMLGDDVVKGQAAVYELEVKAIKFRDKNGVVKTEYRILDAVPTDEKVRLYTKAARAERSAFKRRERQRIEGNSSYPKKDADGISEGVMRSRGSLSKMVAQAVEMPVNKLMSSWQERIWDEEKKKAKNEMDRVEEEMEENWVNQMHFGRQM